MKDTLTTSRILLIVLIWSVWTQRCQAERPNILWITAEDMSPTLGCYGDDYATTPNIDQLSNESVRFTHAFATSPVCSPSRNCLITGMYPTALGTQHMRSAFPIPDAVRGFPEYLREAGYFTSNNVKTDYNTAAAPRLIQESWDDSSDSAHWRNRSDASAPFFSVFNLMVSHQSRTMVWPTEQFVAEVQSKLSPSEIHAAEEAPLPPYYPDTHIVRREVARYYDCVTVMDQQVGAILKQLDEDGLADDTIVFFFSDHGSGMPRHKRVLLDSGMHVPLLVRFPEKFSDLAPAAPGEVTDQMASFVDFPPTVLTLAGLEPPRYMQGFSLFGDASEIERVYVMGHRDRIDETFDMARSVRSRRFLYVRNFMPHLGYNQPSAWPNAGDIDAEFLRLSEPDALSPAIQQYVDSRRPVEQFFDCEADPLNLHNLVDDPGQHADRLREMRTSLVVQMLNTGDRGVIPESLLFHQADRYRFRMDAKRPDQFVGQELNAALQSGVQSESGLYEMMSDDLPGVRYWGVIGCCRLESLDDKTINRLRLLLDDKEPAVRIVAADALARRGHIDWSLPVLQQELTSEDLNVVLQAMRTIELIGVDAKEVRATVQEVVRACESNEAGSGRAVFDQSARSDLMMFIAFSGNAFLNRIDETVPGTPSQ